MNRSIKFLSFLTVTGLMGFASLKFIPQSNAKNLLGAPITVESNLNQTPFSNHWREEIIASDLKEAEYEAREHRQLRQQYAVLYSQYSDVQINVRSGPGTNYRIKHYGYSGDPVDILDSSSRGNDGYRWYNLRFANSGAKGWVREDLISFVED